MRKYFLTIFIIVVSGIISCSFFDPRDPANPDPGEEIPWQQPYAPSTVVINLKNTMEGRSIPMTMACCDSSYMFIADGADTAQYGSSWDFSDWDYQVEQNTMMNIYNAVQASGFPDDSLVSVTMDIIDSLPDPVAPADSAEIWRDYQIIIAGCSYSGWDNPAKGRVKFLMVEDAYGLWSMRRWFDYRPDNYSGEFYTWAVAKVTYR